MNKYNWLIPNSKNYLIWGFSLLMICGLYLFNWKAETILLTYFFETIAIGFIHIFKLLATFLYSTSSTDRKGKHPASSFFYIPFFAVHYFFFIFIQSVFVFAFFTSIIPGLKDSFDVWGNYKYLLGIPEYLMAFMSIVMVNVAFAFKNFFLLKKYEIKQVESLFTQPYLRIFIQQFVTILTGFTFLFLKADIISALILILIRLIIDLALNYASYNLDFRDKLIKVMNNSNNPRDMDKARKDLNMFLDD